MRTRTSQLVAPVVGAVLLLAGLIALGKAARDQLRQHESYSVSLADIDCPAPPGQPRDQFLAEVQYLARLPDRLAALDDDTPSRLSAAFARHPWVEKVQEVRVAPPDRARVRLVFRTPALAVVQPDGVRVVDAAGILLPAGAPSEGLPVLRDAVAPPAGLAGESWGDPAVTAAAAATRRPHGEP
jgi:hypothetical protein